MGPRFNPVGDHELRILLSGQSHHPAHGLGRTGSWPRRRGPLCLRGGGNATAITGTFSTNGRPTTARRGRRPSNSTPTRTLPTRRSGCLRCPPPRMATSPPPGTIVARPPAPATALEIRDVTTSAWAVSRTTNGASWNSDITISTKHDHAASTGRRKRSCPAMREITTTTPAWTLRTRASTGTAYVTWTDGRHKIGGVPVQSVDFAAVPEP